MKSWKSRKVTHMHRYTHVHTHTNIYYFYHLSLKCDFYSSIGYLPSFVALTTFLNIKLKIVLFPFVSFFWGYGIPAQILIMLSMIHWAFQCFSESLFPLFWRNSLWTSITDPHLKSDFFSLVPSSCQEPGFTAFISIFPPQIVIKYSFPAFKKMMEWPHQWISREKNLLPSSGPEFCSLHPNQLSLTVLCDSIQLLTKGLKP